MRVVLVIFVPFSYGLLIPVNTSPGTSDLTSINDHMIQLEQKVSSLQKKLEKQEQCTAELSTVKQQLSTVQSQLSLTTTELDSVKTDMNTLKRNINSSCPSLNITILDSISSDVKTSIREISALNSSVHNTVQNVIAVKANTTNLQGELQNASKTCLQNEQSLASSIDEFKRWENESSTQLVHLETAIIRESIKNQNASEMTVRLLEAKFENATSKINISMGNISYIAVEISSLKDVVSEVKSNISNLQSMLMNVSTVCPVSELSLEAKLDEMIIRHNESNKHLDETEELIKEIFEKLNASEKEIRHLKTKLENEVSSLLDSSNNSKAVAETGVKYQVLMETPNLFSSQDHILRFDKVLLNAGNGFDLATGTFTAPVAGAYLFWANVVHNSNISSTDVDMCLQNRAGSLDIHDSSDSLYTDPCRNSQRVAVGTSYPGQNGYDTAIVILVIHLHAGDKVWFESTIIPYYLYGHLYSGYGGILL